LQSRGHGEAHQRVIFPVTRLRSQRQTMSIELDGSRHSGTTGLSRAIGIRMTILSERLTTGMALLRGDAMRCVRAAGTRRGRGQWTGDGMGKVDCRVRPCATINNDDNNNNRS
jgi:hypothetical protein